MSKFPTLQEQLDSERKLVSFDSYDLTVRQLLDMVEEGSVFVPPEYQRQFIWEPKRQSTLVESILLGIPVPSLFMATNPDSSWEVVDGVQRIGSLSHFIGNPKLLNLINKDSPLEIAGLSKLSALNGSDYLSLPKSVQLHLQTRPMKVTVLNDRSDLSVRFDLFERLNTGGIKLTEQEIRNCVYRGQFNDDLKDLSNQPNFRAVVKLGDASPGGSYEEMALRFFAYLENYNGFDHLVKEFLNKYMQANKQHPISNKNKIVFDQTFDLLQTALPEGIIRSRAKTPANLYEAISVGIALAIKSGKTPDVQKIEGLLKDDNLKQHTGAGSNQKKHVVNRIEYVKNIV